MNGSFVAGVQTIWDATSISLANTCLRKYKYKMIDGWSSQSLSVHLRFGQHYATALEHFYKHVALGMSREDAMIEVVWEALTDTWDRETCDECKGSGLIPTGAGEDIECSHCAGTGKVGGTPWESLDPNKTRETLVRSIIWYLFHFEDDPTEVIHQPDGKPMVEYSFFLQVDNGITFSGHLDRGVEYASQNWIMDQKTTKSTISSYYFDQFSPHDQFSMYSFAGKAVLAVPIAGVIIDAAQIAVGFTRFERGFTTRTDGQLNEWYDDSMKLIEDTQQATRDDRFPMRPSSCGNYGGCEFRFVCSRAPGVREQFLKGHFDKTEGWDPSARR